MKVVPPSPPTRVGSTRTCWDDEPAAAGASTGSAPAPSAGGAAALGRGRHDELHLDAVADDAREGLADQRAVAGLEPVLGEPVGDADLEALVVHVHELGIAEPGLVVRGRERHLQLAECRSPDLLRVHSFDVTCVDVGRGWVALTKDPKRGTGDTGAMLEMATAPGVLRPRVPDRRGSRVSRRRPGAEGLGEDSTGRRAVARRSCNTPGEYLCVGAMPAASRRRCRPAEGGPGRPTPRD